MSDDSEIATDGTEQSECPLCGQEYQHKRTERKSLHGPEYRSDARVCKSSFIGSERGVYVHLPDNAGTERSQSEGPQ